MRKVGVIIGILVCLLLPAMPTATVFAYSDVDYYELVREQEQKKNETEEENVLADETSQERTFRYICCGILGLGVAFLINYYVAYYTSQPEKAEPFSSGSNRGGYTPTTELIQREVKYGKREKRHLLNYLFYSKTMDNPYDDYDDDSGEY